MGSKQLTVVSLDDHDSELQVHLKDLSITSSTTNKSPEGIKISNVQGVEA